MGFVGGGGGVGFNGFRDLPARPLGYLTYPLLGFKRVIFRNIFQRVSRAIRV